MFIRQLQYLVALAKTRHFGRAAELCHVSQPALSAAIQRLEEELRIAVVRRDHRFQGLTPEGERLLGWAQRILADWEGLRQEAARSRGSITGTLRIGAIPTTMPVVPLLTSQSCAAHPGIHQAVFSLSAEEIILRLDGFELDLGLTYLEDQRLGGFRVLALYRERYLLLAPNRGAFRGRAAMTWSEAAELPLCLLTPICRTAASSTRPSGRRGPHRMLRSRPTPPLRSIPTCAAPGSTPRAPQHPVPPRYARGGHRDRPVPGAVAAHWAYRPRPRATAPAHRRGLGGVRGPRSPEPLRHADKPRKLTHPNKRLD